MKVIIWHNPRCGTSRTALAYLREQGIEPEIYLYVDERPTRGRIEAVLKKLKAKPSEALRKGEAEGVAAGIYDSAGEAKILAAMVKHPILIQRPIVIGPKGAVIARPAAEIPSKIDAVL